MAIKLTKETKDRLTDSIKRFFEEKMEDEVGDLKASLLLDFCLQEIGPSIYNQAIVNAQAYMNEKISDIDGTCYESEFGYWDK